MATSFQVHWTGLHAETNRCRFWGSDLDNELTLAEGDLNLPAGLLGSAHSFHELTREGEAGRSHRKWTTTGKT